MKHRLYCILAVLASFLMIASIAFAQTSSGEIRGRVVDPGNAVVVNARVTLTSQSTGDTRKTQTNGTGDFVFVAVQPGTFAIIIEAPGFKQSEKRELKLSASDRLSAGTIVLEVGAVSQTVSVEAEATTVQVDSSERSALIDSKEMSTLMSLGRDPLALLRILPGVVKDDNGSNGFGTQGAGTIAGVRESSNAVSIDGVNGNPRGDGNKLDTPVAMDAVAEVKVVLNSYQAEYGQSAGAIINMTTKSGTQDFHGAAYYYGRNEALNANSWLNNYEGTPRQRYRYNTYGWNVGGPIFVPNKFNSKKDKLFFFYSQEKWPTKGSTGPQRYLMPTAAERKGDFSKTYDFKGNKVYVRDPLLSGTCSASNQAACFPGNIIPTDRINLNTQKVMNVFPLPNIDCVINGAGGGTPCPLTNGTSGDPYNYEITGPREDPSDQILLRLDYNLSSKWKMYFRGMRINRENRGLNSTTNKHQWGIPTYYSTPSKNAGINVTYIASPTLVNEFTVGYASWAEQQGFDVAADVEKLSRSALGVTLGQNNPDQNPLNLLPRITGMSSGGSSGTFQLKRAPEINFDNRFPMDNSTGTWEITDGLTKVWNNHTFKGGVYFQLGNYTQRHIGSVFSGNFNFGANSSSPYDTQYAYSNLLLGSYGSYQEGSNIVNYAPRWHILEWYGQDSWRVKSNLTVSYGIRFTYDLPTELQSGMGAGFVPDRYDPSQAPNLYKPVAYNSLSATAKTACKGLSRSTPSRCAQNPNNPADIKSDAFIGTFVNPFNYSGTVINTDPSYPSSLRYGNGVLLAPRFGVSWDPFKDGKTAIRLGAGLYYNTREGGGTVGDYSLIAPLVTNASVGFGQITQESFKPGCGSDGSCYGTATKVNAGPVDTRILQPNRAVESTLGVNLGVQRNIGFSTVVDVAYVGTFGRHLNQQVNLNAIPYGAQFDPNAAYGTAWNPAWIDPSQTSKNCYFGKAASGSDLYCQPKLLSDNYFRAYPGYGAVNLRDYGATSNYNALQTSVNRRFTKGLQFGASYTWSKVLTYMDTVNGSVANFQDRKFWNYGLADFDRSHNFVFHWTANLPKASSLWNNKVLKAIGDNWEWSGIAQFQTGEPLRVDDSGAANLTGGGDGARPLLFGDPYAPKDQIHDTLQFINPNVWFLPCAPGMSTEAIAVANCKEVGFLPTPNTYGMTRLNIGRGPGINNWDMALQKNIPIREQMKFTIRVEAYNVFNHVSFNSVDMALPFDTSSSCQTSGLNGANGCGQVKSPATATFGQVDGERGARRLQLSARFTF
ncbi:MAG TPA: TonB-dependent receptor [Clostridia bacterium]|nr:TonB-dependent receptor [Clostridia bacterium]